MWIGGTSLCLKYAAWYTTSCYKPRVAKPERADLRDICRWTVMKWRAMVSAAAEGPHEPISMNVQAIPADDLVNRFLSPAARRRTQQAIEELKSWLAEKLSVAESVREQHSHGEASGCPYPPDAVVWPESTEEVSRIVAICAKYQIPVIAFGAGTSLEGHVSAPYGGVCIDLSRMSQVLDVRAEDSDCVVQPGVTREQLNSYLRDTGLFFPVDPGANASLGGMVSTRASGTTTIRYGAMTRNVLALQVVLADGRIVRLGTRAAKSSTGYDLVRLMVGAEGTLGIITEITLRLYKGNIDPVSRKSPNSLYSLNIASFTMGAEYDQKDALGFINCIGLPIKVRASLQGK